MNDEIGKMIEPSEEQKKASRCRHCDEKGIPTILWNDNDLFNSKNNKGKCYQCKQVFEIVERKEYNSVKVNNAITLLVNIIQSVNLMLGEDAPQEFDNYLYIIPYLKSIPDLFIAADMYLSGKNNGKNQGANQGAMNMFSNLQNLLNEIDVNKETP